MPGIISPTADFSNSGLGRGLLLTSNRAGLTAECLFGRNLATSRVNSAGAKAKGAEMTTSDAPAQSYGDHQVELGNGAGLNLNVPNSGQARTYIIACSAQAPGATTISTAAVLIGMGAAGVGDGSNAPSGVVELWSRGSTGKVEAIFFHDTDRQTLPLPNVPAGTLSDPRVFSIQLAGASQNSATRVAEYKAGGLVQEARGKLDVAMSVPTAAPIAVGSRAGSGVNTLFRARTKHVSFLAYDRALTDEEVLAVYIEQRTILAGMGKAI